jgi:hypothetical protein
MHKSRKILVAWLGVYALLGVLSGVTGLSEKNDRAFNVIAGIPTMILIYMWCRAEALERRVVVPSGYTMFASIFAPLGIPVYFLRTRKPVKSALVSIVKSFSFYIGAFLLLAVIETAIHALRT